MKRLSLSTLLCLAGACIAAHSLERPNAAPVGDGGAIQEGFQLQARVDKPAFQPQEPVIVSVTVRNTTAVPRVFHETGKMDGSGRVWTDRMFKATVKDSRGKVVPLTAYGKSIWEKAILPPGMERTLGDGQEVIYKLLLNRANDMTLSDTYSLTVSRHFFSKDGKRWPLVVSNTVQVKVAEE